MSSKIYKISIDGCDDSTSFEMKLSEGEAELINNVAKIATETSSYGCMPTMSIHPLDGEMPVTHNIEWTDELASEFAFLCLTRQGRNQITSIPLLLKEFKAKQNEQQ